MQRTGSLYMCSGTQNCIREHSLPLLSAFVSLTRTRARRFMNVWFVCIRSHVCWKPWMRNSESVPTKAENRYCFIETDVSTSIYECLICLYAFSFLSKALDAKLGICPDKTRKPLLFHRNGRKHVDLWMFDLVVCVFIFVESSGCEIRNLCRQKLRTAVVSSKRT